jgi:cell division protein FtsB
MNKNTTLIISIIITALVAGGGIYLWQHSVSVERESESLSQRNQLQQQIDNLDIQLNQLSQDKEELRQQIDDLNAQLNPPAPERYVKIVSPNGGENLCLNSETTIEWESKGVDVVSVRIMKQAFEGTNYYYIDDLSAVSSTYNEEGVPGKGLAVWKVKNIPVGQGYKIEIMSAGSASRVSDISDSVFSVIVCEG